MYRIHTYIKYILCIHTQPSQLCTHLSELWLISLFDLSHCYVSQYSLLYLSPSYQTLLKKDSSCLWNNFSFLFFFFFINQSTTAVHFSILSKTERPNSLQKPNAQLNSADYLLVSQPIYQDNSTCKLVMQKDLVGEDRVGTFALKIDTLCLFPKQYSSTTHTRHSEVARAFFFFLLIQISIPFPDRAWSTMPSICASFFSTLENNPWPVLIYQAIAVPIGLFLLLLFALLTFPSFSLGISAAGLELQHIFGSCLLKMASWNQRSEVPYCLYI